MLFGCAFGRRSGQSMIETCLVLLLVGFIFAGALQISRISAAKEVLQYGASCGARAKTVGFNRWMVEKCIRAGTIANAGRMITPAFVNHSGLNLNIAPGKLWWSTIGMTPSSAQFAIERARMPDYLDSANNLRAQNILDYEDWDTISFDARADARYGSSLPDLNTRVQVTAHQDYPLNVPVARAFCADTNVSLTGEFEMEANYPLYLNDFLW